MQIDWITVAAQIVNFLVLVWLLQHFLYRPITRAMKKREQGIEDRLTEARAKQETADREAQIYRDKQQDLDRQREDILNQAREDAKQLRQNLEKETHEAVKQEREAWLAQLAGEHEEFLHDLRTRTARHIQEVCRGALCDLAGAELEAQMAARFVDRLGTLPKEELEKIAASARQPNGSILIESSFNLPDPVRTALTKSVHAITRADAEVAFAHPGDAPLGLRLRVGSQQVEWSLNRYLDQVERAAEQNLSQIEVSGRQQAA